uniref:SGNH/GDSL hydrolase family protein n=1 Tax=Bacillus mycoides TaxID=1405 RepID=UPI0011A016F4
NQIGILSELETTNKTNLVKAINEAKNSGLTEQQKQDLTAAKTDASTAKTEATTARTEKIPATRLDTSSDANKIKQINLSDEVKQMMAGTTPVNATPQDGSVTYQKTAFLEIKYDNLVDVSKLTEGYLSGTGTVTASTVAYLTDFIPVVYGKTYISKIANGGTWGSHYYKSDKTGVKRITLNADNSFTVDDNTVAYVRLVFYPKPTDNKDMMMVEGKVYPTSYIPYEERVNITDQKFEKAIGKVAKVKVDEGLADIANVLPDKSITASKTNFLYEKRINLYDPSKAISGTINQTTGAVSPFAGAWASDFIPVVEGKTYKTNATFNSGFYDSNKSFVQGLANYNGTVTAPTGKDIKYVRMSYNGDANAAMFVEGEFLPTTYIPYTRIEIAPIDATTKQGLLRQLDKLNGLKWNCLGDSITFGLNGRPYHQWIYDRTGVIPRNYGVSSTSIAVRSGRTDSMVERFSSMLDDADVVTVLGGVNDKGNSVPLGTMSDRVNTTFYGACHILFKGLVEKYKGKRIGVMSPLPTYVGNDTLKPYVDVEREVARFYSIPFLDLYNESGLSATLDSMQSGYIPDGLHPNDAGHNVISRRIETFLKSL